MVDSWHISHITGLSKEVNPSLIPRKKLCKNGSISVYIYIKISRSRQDGYKFHYQQKDHRVGLKTIVVIGKEKNYGRNWQAYMGYVRDK